MRDRCIVCVMRDTPVHTSPARGTQATSVDPLFVTVKDAARVLALSPKTIYRLMDAGEIEDTYHGRKRMAVYASVLAYGEKLRSETRTRRTQGGAA